MRRRPGGYTLIELGLVMGVLVVFLTALAATGKTFYREARGRRTGDELNALASAAANALRRNLKVQQPGNAFFFKFDSVTAVPVTPLTPLCYDLSRFPGAGGACPATGAAGAAWSSGFAPAVSPVPAGSPLLTMLGGGKIYSNGFNPWCEPYVVCLYPYKAEAVTCVPTDNLGAAGLTGAMSCGACGSPSPLTQEPTTCVVVAAPIARENVVGQLKFSYSGPLFDPGWKPLPMAYTPNTQGY